MSNFREILGQRSLLDQVNEAFNEEAIVSVTDRSGVITYANANFCGISGYTEAELLGSPHNILKSGLHNHGFFGEMWRTINSGKTWHGEIKNRRKDGTFYWILASVIPLKEADGTIKSFVSISHDITDRKEAHARLIQASKLSALGEATAKIAHDLNNPLSVIMGMTQLLLRRGELNPKAKELSEKVLKASERMERLIKQMRKQARNSSEDPRQALNLNEVILNSLILYESSLAQNSIELQLDLNDNNLQIFGDLSQIESVLQNLISNSIDAFNKPHSGTPIENRLIHLAVKKEEDQGWIIYEDNAGGIPESVQKHMFDAFYTTKEAGHGTGLGLSIMKTIVEEHKGQLSFHSDYGVGTKFYIRFPLHGAQASPESSTEEILPVVKSA